MVKCKYFKKCKWYSSDSFTCNKDQFKEDGYPYCGKYREEEQSLGDKK